MAAGQIRAGAAFIEISAQDKYSAALNKLQLKLDSIGAAAKALGQKVALSGVAMEGGIVAAAKAYAEMGDAVAKAATRTGIAAGTLSELSYAATQSGTDLETLEKGVGKLAKGVVAAAGGNAQAAASFKALGLSAGQLLDVTPDEQFKKIADAISGIPNPTERAAAAISLFGKGGAALLPLMADGARGINQLQQAARNLGISFTTQDARAAEEFGDRLDDLGKVGKAAIFQLGAAAAPAVREIAVGLTGGISAVIKYIEANRESIGVYGELVASNAAYAVALGGTVFALGKVISVGAGAVGTLNSIGKAVNGVTSLTGAVSAASAALAANPLTLAVVGTGAVVAAVYALTQLAEAEAEVAAIRLESHAAEKIAVDADRSRASVERLLDVLSRLSEKNNLTPEDEKSAEGVIAKLTARYGDLGVSIDSATGKLTGLAQAYRQINVAETQRAIQEQLNIAKEANRAQSAIERQIGETSDKASYNGDLLETLKARSAIDGFKKQSDAQRLVEQAAREKAKDLQQQLKDQGRSDVFRGAGSAIPDDEDDEAKAKADKPLEDRKRLDELARSQRLAGLDEEARKIAEVNDRYDDQIAVLKRLYDAAVKAQNKPEIASIQAEAQKYGSQRDTDIAKVKDAARTEGNQKLNDLDRQSLTDDERKIAEVNDRYKEQLDLIKKLNDAAKAAGDKTEQKRLAAEGFKAYGQQQADLHQISTKLAEDRQSVELKLQEELAEREGRSVDAIALKKKLAQAEFEKSIEDFYRNDPAGKARVIALQKQVLDVPQITATAAGVFDTVGAGQSLQSGGGVADRIAKATEKTASGVADLARRKATFG